MRKSDSRQCRPVEARRGLRDELERRKGRQGRLRVPSLIRARSTDRNARQSITAKIEPSQSFEVARQADWKRIDEGEVPTQISGVESR